MASLPNETTSNDEYDDMFDTIKAMEAVLVESSIPQPKRDHAFKSLAKAQAKLDKAIKQEARDRSMLELGAYLIDELSPTGRVKLYRQLCDGVIRSRRLLVGACEIVVLVGETDDMGERIGDILTYLSATAAVWKGVVDIMENLRTRARIALGTNDTVEICAVAVESLEITYSLVSKYRE